MAAMSDSAERADIDAGTGDRRARPAAATAAGSASAMRKPNSAGVSRDDAGSGTMPAAIAPKKRSR